MGRKHDKKDKKAKKRRKHGGRIADLRAAAEPVLNLARSPLVNEVIAGALVAGIEAFASGRKGAKAAGAAGEAADAAADKTARKASAVGDALSAAAQEIANRFIAAYAQGGASNGGGKKGKSGR